jgi:hypothetical protein
LIRCLPVDSTNGFFVCAFERRDPADKAQAVDVKPTESTKRAREDVDMEVETEKAGSPVRDTKSETIKTAAQAERLRRKKQQQKAKKRKVD